MRASQFNVRVPLTGSKDVFLMNTFTDAQVVVSPDVVALVDRVDRGAEASACSPDERDALASLSELGFVVESREHEQQALRTFFSEFREDTSEMRLTVLTTLQCNFACDYCIQGDHGDYNRHAAKMSADTMARVADWAVARLDAIRPRRFVLTFFGGEPLLNLPVVYGLAERMWDACRERGVEQLVNIITNGLLLTPEVVDRLQPFGLNGVKITLDGDRTTHDGLRPLRGGQGTFDKIVANLRRVAGKVRIAIGGNFDEASVGSYPALLAFLRQQSFASSISKVTFKPVIRDKPSTPKGFIPLTAVDGGGKPLGGACMSTAGHGGSAAPAGGACDTCHFADDQMSALREETRRHGFSTADGVHMGPCELHRRHAYTIGPDGAMFACPGFSGEAAQSVGHIDGRRDAARAAASERFERLAAWSQCEGCAFVPVCAGGCAVASHHELGDMAAPACHKSSFESALVTLAHDAVGTSEKERVA